MSSMLAGRLRRLATTVTAAVVALGITAAAARADEAGIDVSRWQHGSPIDWQAVADDGVSFAFVKATEGATYVNPYLGADWADTARVGILRGAYHFARPDGRPGDAIAEAHHFVATAGRHQAPGELPPVLDLEDHGGLDPAALQAWVRTWLSAVEELTGRIPVVYVSPSFWESRMGDTGEFTRHSLWIAHYGVTAPRVPGGWPTWTFWQGTSAGRVSGISGDVDRNTFRGTLRELRALANVPPPAPVRISTVATLRAERQVVRRGGAVRLLGRLTTEAGWPVTDTVLAVQARRPGTDRWRRVARVTSRTPSGRYVVRVSPRRTTLYRAVQPGSDRLRPTTSGPVRVTVRR